MIIPVALFITLILIIFALIFMLGWQLKIQSDAEVIRQGREAQTTTQYVQVLINMHREASSHMDTREANLRGEIQALTMALGRSKEYVPIVYPRDVDRPLEPSMGGHFDRPPRIQSIKVRE